MGNQLNKAANIIFISLLFIVLFNWIGWPYHIRFDYIPLNYLAYSFLCFSLPVSALLASSLLISKTLKVSGVVCSVLIAIPAFLLGGFAFIGAQDVIESGEDASFEYLKQTKSDLGTYRLYRTNCGATCAYGLDLRKEMELPLGIKLVKTVWSQNRIDNADLITTDYSIKVVHNNVVQAEIN